MNRRLLAAATLVFALAQDSTGVVGCYVASPALTYSRTGEPERGDSSWSVVQLSDGGAARRPLLRASRDQRSSWTLAADTLLATFHDGLAGWRLRLTRMSEGWMGTAQYLSDAIVMGRPPYRHAITLRSVKCIAPG